MRFHPWMVRPARLKTAFQGLEEVVLMHDVRLMVSMFLSVCTNARYLPPLMAKEMAAPCSQDCIGLLAAVVR